MEATYQAVVALTDALCQEHLDDEYRALARVMAAALARKGPRPPASGQVRSWACGIVYSLGPLIFRSDRTSQQTMMMAEVCARFGGRAEHGHGHVADHLRTHRMDPASMLRRLIEPIHWCGWRRSTGRWWICATCRVRRRWSRPACHVLGEHLIRPGPRSVRAWPSRRRLLLRRGHARYRAPPPARGSIEPNDIVRLLQLCPGCCAPAIPLSPPFGRRHR